MNDHLNTVVFRGIFCRFLEVRMKVLVYAGASLKPLTLNYVWTVYVF